MALISTFSPSGTRISSSPGPAIAGITTETTLFTDNVKANTLVEGKYYEFRIDLAVTTGAVNLSNLTFKVKYGAQIFTIVSTAPLGSSLTSAPVTIQGFLVGRSPSTQFLTATVQQPTGIIVSLTTSNAAMRNTMTVDATIDQTFTITAQLSGTTVGSTTVVIDWILRPDY